VVLKSLEDRVMYNEAFESFVLKVLFLTTSDELYLIILQVTRAVLTFVSLLIPYKCVLTITVIHMTFLYACTIGNRTFGKRSDPKCPAEMNGFTVGFSNPNPIRYFIFKSISKSKSENRPF